MKNTLKILVFIGIILSLFSIFNANAAIQGLETVQGIENIEDNSSTIYSNSSSISDNVETIGISLLQKVKYIFSGVMLIFIVYAGAQMIMSMGTDEDDLSSSKRTIRYSMIGLIFINIPGTLYEAFQHSNNSVGGGVSGVWNNSPSSSIFINVDAFKDTLNNSIVSFIEIMMVSIGILVIILAGIKIITSRGKEENITEAKNKIIWSIIGLIFVGFIEAWQTFAYSGDIDDGKNIFEAIANLALFIAGPVAIFFLTIAGYYYITSAGDDEKITKAKTIVINTVIGTVLILLSYLFLEDLSTLLK